MVKTVEGNKVVEHDLNKLPKWARWEIERLEKNVNYWRDRGVDAAKGGSAHAFVEVDKRASGGPDMLEIPLPSDHVVYRVGKSVIDCRVSSQGSDEPYLRISASERRLAVFPEGSTSIRVEEQPW